MSNRVEELESRVAKLEDAVDGLTEELVETRERLSTLEADEGIDNTRTPERRTPETTDNGGDDVAPDTEAASEAESADTEAEDDSDSDGNDIIIA